jgi:hypothetical protein
MSVSSDIGALKTSSTAWHSLPADHALKALQTSCEGLSEAEAASRLQVSASFPPLRRTQSCSCM